MKRVTKNLKKLPKIVIDAINDKEGVPYLEQIRVKEYDKRIPELEGVKDVILPFSGGLDSTSSLLMALESSYQVQTVFFDYGQPYSVKEKFAIRQILTALEKSEYSEQLIKHTFIDISWLLDELNTMFPGSWAHIFPMRNFIILTMAASLSDAEVKEIWFSPVQGEIPYSGGDKSSVFMNYMDKYLSNELNTSMRLPVFNLTKGDLVNWAMADDFRRNIISKTISCFGSEGTGNCGKCQSCFNRSVAFFMHDAMAYSGIDINDTDFDEFIALYKVKLKKNSYYSARRRKEIANFVENYK